MVKGLNRRIVVIKSPDKNLFEEAIFIIREDALHRGVTGEEIVMEAQRVANGYTGGSRSGFFRRLPVIVYAAALVLLLAAVGAVIYFL